MSSGFHIAVFAKAPIVGEVKTRLIPLLGKEGAAAAHRKMTWHALNIARTAAAGNVSLWTAGQHNHPFLRDCSARVGAPIRPQCDGDLGVRMADCFHHLLPLHAHVLLIGSDCPVLSVLDLRNAAAALTLQRQMVFTPAEDGGYVLVGMRQRSADRHPYLGDAAFKEIDWGTANVMQQTRTRLQAVGWQQQRDWAELPTCWDVDTPDDYRRALREELIADS